MSELECMRTTPELKIPPLYFACSSLMLHFEHTFSVGALKRETQEILSDFLLMHAHAIADNTAQECLLLRQQSP